MSKFIYPYRSGSQSVISLSDGLNARRIKLDNSRFRGGPNKIVINWGNTTPNEEISKCRILNNPDTIRNVSNKKKFFELMNTDGGPRLPEWSTDSGVVLSKVKDGEMWLARTTLSGHSGEGIVVMEDEDEFVEAPLYTKYVKKKNEYRIHVSNNGVFDIQRKAKRNDADEGVDWRIRNHANGFIYMRGDSNETPEDVINQAEKSFSLSGLDFGAVDVIWNEYRQEAYVLEINSAPGLTGTTLENYINMFMEI